VKHFYSIDTFTNCCPHCNHDVQIIVEPCLQRVSVSLNIWCYCIPQHFITLLIRVSQNS